MDMRKVYWNAMAVISSTRLGQKLSQLTFSLTLSLCLQSAVGWATPPQNPRSLPSLVVQWEKQIETDSAAISNNVVYVQGEGRITALDTRNGSVLWGVTCIKGKQRWHIDLLVLEDTIVGAADRGLCLVDLRTGTVRKRIDPQGSIFQVIGLPLVVDVLPDDAPKFGGAYRHQLVRLNHLTGEIVARKDLGGMILDVMIANGVVLAKVEKLILDPSGKYADSTKMGRAPRSIIGLRPNDLEVIWEQKLKATQPFVVIKGRVHIQLDPESNEVTKLLPIDPLTGTLGPALPLKATQEIQRPRDNSRSSSARLQRLNLETGETLWTTELPDTPHTWVRRGDRLIVHCGGFPGRGYLAVLDWQSGAVLTTAYGLRGVRALFLFQDLLIARSTTEVVAISVEQFGPPEEKLRPVKEEVQRILSAYGRGEAYFAKRGGRQEEAVTDLKALGPEALPFLSEAITSLGPFALEVAARVLGEATYHPSAPALAKRLLSFREKPEQRSDPDLEPQLSILRALSRVGGLGEVAVVSSILDDPSRDAQVRQQAFTTLASIGTPEADRAIESVLKMFPKTPKQSPKSEQQQIVESILQQFFLFNEKEVSRDELAVVVSDFPIEWSRSSGKSIILSEEAAKRFRKEAKTKHVLISIRPGGQRHHEERSEKSVGSDDRLYSLTLDHGPLAAVGYEVIIRELGQRWIIKELHVVWVS